MSEVKTAVGSAVVTTINSSHASRISDIMSVAFPHGEGYSSEMVQGYCRNGNGVAALVNDYVVGFLIWDIEGRGSFDKSNQTDERQHLISLLAVDVKYRRRGLAREMMEQVLCGKFAGQTAYLFMRANNNGAYALYKRLGFKAVEIISGFYRSTRKNDDAYLMKYVPTAATVTAVTATVTAATATATATSTSTATSTGPYGAADDKSSVEEVKSSVLASTAALTFGADAATVTTTTTTSSSSSEPRHSATDDKDIKTLDVTLPHDDKTVVAVAVDTAAAVATGAKRVDNKKKKKRKRRKGKTVRVH